MHNNRGRELKLVRLRSDRAADLGGTVKHLDIVRCSRRKPKQTADETTVVNAHERVTGMPGGVAALTIHQVRFLRQVGTAHDNTNGLDVGI